MDGGLRPPVSAPPRAGVKAGGVIRTKDRGACLAFGLAFRNCFVENKRDDWVRLASFCFADAAFAVLASRDGKGCSHAGLIIAGGLAMEGIAD
jgi:hypothetical protein